LKNFIVSFLSLPAVRLHTITRYFGTRFCADDNFLMKLTSTGMFAPGALEDDRSRIDVVLLLIVDGGGDVSDDPGWWSARSLHLTSDSHAMTVTIRDGARSLVQQLIESMTTN
jgi:hypothetical protein